MITLIYAASDAQLGTKLQQDLTQAGHQVSDQVQHDKTSLTILIHSPQSSTDSVVQKKVIQALEYRQHVIPVMAEPAPLPKLINNLQPLDFTENRYPLDELLDRIKTLSAPDAPRPLTTLTPSVRKSNRQTGIVLSVIVGIMFLGGIYLVGVMGIQYPREEYDFQETARVQQRNTLIGPTLEWMLPRTTDDAISFQSTVDAVPTRLRPFLAETATSFILGTATPEPTHTPTP